MSDQSAAEQRAFAVAKLKRAASLPRMQNGRRPKMHVEAVSEGERSHGAASVEPDSSEAPTPEPRRSPGPEDITIHQPVAAFATALIEPPTPTQADIPQEPPEASQSDVVPDPEPEVEIETEAEPAPAKKRRRSRSRSRGSRDLRKLKGAQSPPLPTGGTTTPAPADDSSPEDIPHTLPPFMPFTPQVLAPIPSHFAQFQAQRLLMTPEPGMFFGAAAASPTSPSTPMPGFPSLEDIQRGAMARGLQRSNSAAARLMALNKLQGGVPELPSRSNTPAPLGTLGLGRNNTVSGAEPRAAARQILLRRLGERIDKADGNTSGEERATTPKLPTSSGEEDIARPTTPRRRKRRSRRASNAGPGEVVDDRELAGEAALAPPTPSLSELGTTFTPTASDVGNSQLQRSNTLAKLLGQSRSEAASTPRVTTPRNRRSIVVELDEDDTPIEPEPSSLMSNDGLPVPMPAFAAAERVPYSSNDSFGVPMFYEEKTMYTDDAFPSSPFATPLRERPPMDDEQVLFSSAVPRPWQTTAERDVSWVDDPREYPHLNGVYMSMLRSSSVPCTPHACQ
jgi:serine/arginine repetitive matrix protein 2